MFDKDPLGEHITAMMDLYLDSMEQRKKSRIIPTILVSTAMKGEPSSLEPSH